MTDVRKCVFGSGEDDGGSVSGTELDSDWECRIPAYSDDDLCVFHMGVEDRGLAGVADDEVRDAFVRAVEGTEEGEPCRFVGGSFGETVVEKEVLGENAEVIDLRNSEFDGRFELNCDVVEADLLLDDSELEIFSAPNVVFKGDVSFQGCHFEGDVVLDSAKFEGDVSFEKAKFELQAEFSETVFGNVSFRLSKHRGAKTNFKKAGFKGKARMSRISFNKSDFTGAEFGSSADFSGTTFGDETKFQYTTFHGGVDFGSSDFNANSAFRGAGFARKVSFDDASFQGWVSFLDVEFNDDVSFESVWFRSEVRMVAESTKDAVVKFKGARMGKASFEIDPRKPVVLDFTRARVGNLSISVDGESDNPLNYVRFVETEFDGFDFSDYADDLSEKSYVIHEDAVKSEGKVKLPSLEKTYRLAYEGAKGDADSIASKFAKKEGKYRRKKYRENGKILRYLLDFLPV